MSNVTSTIETEPTLNPSHRIRRHLPVWLAVVAVIVLAVNLRPGATSIGPLLSELRAGLHMGPGVAALLSACHPSASPSSAPSPPASAVASAPPAPWPSPPW